MLSLEEAIKHCEEVAYQKDLESGFETDNERYAMTDKERIDCKKCAEEHRQLAEWLRALKEIWDSGDCNDCRNGQCEWRPKLGHLVRFNCPHYVGIANEEVNADADSD